jgi:membrane-associated phospholipid phosphatase
MNINVKKGINNLTTFYKTYRGIDTLFLEIFIGVLAILGSLYIFLKLSHKVIDKEIIFFDKFIMDLLYDAHSPFLTEIMKTVTFFGGEIFIGFAITTTIALLFWTKHRKDAVLFTFILLFGILLNLWLKGFFERLRPDEIVLIIEKTYSFPSGHSMNSFIFFMSLTYFVFHNTRNKKLGLILSFLSVITVLSIGISRIYLGVHYPSDVLGGYAVGLLWFAGVLLFEKMLIFLKLFREFELNKKY